ncbi:MAG: hypothetical protein WKF86_00020 [Acidimicrobiales bacterium]
MTGDEYRIALRPLSDAADPDLMDDVVIRDVSMFRAEQMDSNSWWVACYLAGTGGGARGVEEEVVFHFRWNRKEKNLEMRHNGHRIPGVVYEDDPIGVDPDQMEMF